MKKLREKQLWRKVIFGPLWNHFSLKDVVEIFSFLVQTIQEGYKDSYLLEFFGGNFFQLLSGWDLLWVISYPTESYILHPGIN